MEHVIQGVICQHVTVLDDPQEAVGAGGRIAAVAVFAGIKVVAVDEEGGL